MYSCSRSEFPLHSPCTSPAVPRQPAAQISLRSRAAMNVQDETGAGTGACLACTVKHRAHTCGRVIGQRKRRSPLATLENELAFSKHGPLMQRGCCEGCLCKGRQIQGLQDDLAEYRLVNTFRLEMARGLGVTQFYENFVWAQWLPTQQRFTRTSPPPTQFWLLPLVVFTTTFSFHLSFSAETSGCFRRVMWLRTVPRRYVGRLAKSGEGLAF